MQPDNQVWRWHGQPAAVNVGWLSIVVAAWFLLLCPQPLAATLVITEVMSDSSHPGAGGTGTANGDWWELTNHDVVDINLAGYSWDDADAIAGVTIFPNVTLAADQSMVIVNENTANLAGFKQAWGLGNDVLVRSKDAFGGTEGFSRFSPNGDQVNLFDPTRQRIASVTFGRAATGRTFAWDAEGAYLGPSTAGQLGAYVAPGNGAGGVGTDVGSPGISFDLVILLGDVNLDTVVNGLDVDPFVDRLIGGVYLAEADMNEDGEVNGLDVDPFVAAVVGSGAARLVPEPPLGVLLIGVLVGAAACRIHRRPQVATRGDLPQSPAGTRRVSDLGF